MSDLVVNPEDRFSHNAAQVISKNQSTVIILNFLTDSSWQTVQTQIRLFLEEQSDQGLHCLLFHLYLFNEIRLASLFEFKVAYTKFFGIRKFRTFTVY